MILDILIGLAAFTIAIPLILVVSSASILGVLMATAALTKKKTK